MRYNAMMTKRNMRFRQSIVWSGAIALAITGCSRFERSRSASQFEICRDRSEDFGGRSIHSRKLAGSDSAGAIGGGIRTPQQRENGPTGHPRLKSFLEMQRVIDRKRDARGTCRYCCRHGQFRRSSEYTQFARCYGRRVGAGTRNSGPGHRTVAGLEPRLPGGRPD